MCDNIFVNDSILKQLPPGVLHPLTPILYAENGVMPASNNKTKKCTIVVTAAGIYLLRPQMFGGYKISSFTSIFQITEIERYNAEKRVFRTQSSFSFFTVDHADAGVVEILKARASLFQDTQDPHPIIIKGYTKAPEFTITSKIQNITVLRYFCLCARFNCHPSEALLEFLKKVDSSSSSSITFPQNSQLPDSIKALYIPIGMMKNVKEVGFDKVCPAFICRVVHFLMKRTSNARSIKLINYTNNDIIPEQLRFEKIQEGTFTFSFVNCQFNLSLWERIIKQFADLKANVQKLSFTNCRMTTKEFELLISAFQKCRCFRTIELLEIDELRFEGSWGSTTPSLLLKVLESCRFLAIFSISNWATPSLFNISDFSSSNMLSEIALRGQDLSQQTLNFTIPQNIRTLDLSKCHFSYQSLRYFFTSLSTMTRKLTLSLADIVLPDGHWDTLFETLSDIPRSKCLYELDWSGNPIPQQFARNLSEFIFRQNPISFISLDKIFTHTNISVLSDFLSACDKKKLWGMSIKGSSAKSIGSSIQKLIEILNDLPELSVLDISNQMITNDSIKRVIEFAKKRSLRQLSVDGTLIDSFDKLIDSYTLIINSKKIKAIARPISDLKRLNVSYEDSRFRNFAQLIKPMGVPATRRIREMYFGSKDTSKRFNGEVLDEIQSIYPLTLIEKMPDDEFGLYPEVSPKTRTSLFAASAKETKYSIDEIQNRCLKSLKESPAVAPTTDMAIPDCLSSLREHPGFFKRGNVEFEIAKQMNFERLCACPEVQNALQQLSETVEIEDEDDNFESTRIEVVDIMPKERGLIKKKEKKTINRKQPTPIKETKKEAPQIAPPMQMHIPTPAPEPVQEPEQEQEPAQEKKTEGPQAAAPKAVTVTIPSDEENKPEPPKMNIVHQKKSPRKRKTLKEWSNDRVIIPTPMRNKSIPTMNASDVPPPVSPVLPPELELPTIVSPPSIAALAKIPERPKLSLINPFDYSFCDSQEVITPSYIPTIEPVTFTSVTQKSIQVQILEDLEIQPLMSLPVIEIKPIPSVSAITESNNTIATPPEQPHLSLIAPADVSETTTIFPQTASSINIEKIESVSEASEIRRISLTIPDFTLPPPSVVPSIAISEIPAFTLSQTIDMRRIRLIPPRITICGPPTEW